MATVYKNIDKKIAKTRVVQGAIDVAAKEIAGRARTLAAAHSDTGAYASSIKVTPAGIDRLVEATDPAAVHIEYGHIEVSKNGTQTWVPGLYILTQAIGG